MGFKVGDIVILDNVDILNCNEDNTYCYAIGKCNPIWSKYHTKGRVIENSWGNYIVKWENGIENSYGSHNLKLYIKVSEAKPLFKRSKYEVQKRR